MVRATGLMSVEGHVAADISAHAGVHLRLERTLEESEEQMRPQLISWNAQGTAKHSAEYFAATLREQHDYDVAILQDWGKTTRLDVGEGDLYLVAPRAEGQKQMGADEERWIGGSPVGQRTRRAEMLTRLPMQHGLAATNAFTAAASGPTYHFDFKRPPVHIDCAMIPARDIWKVSTALEETTDSRNPTTRKVPKLPEGHELMQTLRVVEARRRATRDRVQRAIYSKGIIRIRRKIWTSNRALQHCLHEAGIPLYERLAELSLARSRELLEREYGSAFRASDGEEPVGVSAYPTHFTTEDVLDIPPFSPEMLRESPCDMKAVQALGVGGVVRALDSGVLASLAAVFVNRPRGVPEYARDQAWSKRIIQLMKKKGDMHTPKGSTFEKLYSVGLIKMRANKLALRSPQRAYRKVHRAMDVIFSVRMLAEKASEWNRPIFIMDGDIEAAFDRVSHRLVEETLRRRAVPRPVALAINRGLKASAVIKMGSIQTQTAPRTRGARQGHPASTILFNLVLEDAWEEFLGACGARGWGCEFPGEAGLLCAGNFCLVPGVFLASALFSPSMEGATSVQLVPVHLLQWRSMAWLQRVQRDHGSQTHGRKFMAWRWEMDLARLLGFDWLADAGHCSKDIEWVLRDSGMSTRYASTGVGDKAICVAWLTE
ncbi:unnamed protein product, partial [Prorocentrum cordatum]